MVDQLEDTNTAPSRRKPADAGGRDDAVIDELANTVMTSRRMVADLVEPPRTVVTREDVEAALGPPSAESTPNTGLYSFQIGPYASPVMLDRPARVGRAPAAPRIPTGVAPALICVDSPSHEVSGTHLEVRQVGSSVVVTDLRSTNGSVVMQPGSIPRKLRQGESVVVSPGALVDIGDKNILQILPMQRLG